MTTDRIFKLIENYTPCPAAENDELFPNGIFVFNISTIIEHITTGKLVVEQEDIYIPNWFKRRAIHKVNEKHLLSVSLDQPVIQAEISPGRFNIIDGNHRMEKARRDHIDFVESYKLRGEQLVDYFIDLKGYQSFISYWNSKIEDLK